MMECARDRRESDESMQRVSLEQVLMHQANIEKELSLLRNQVTQQSADTSRKLSAYVSIRILTQSNTVLIVGFCP